MLKASRGSSPSMLDTQRCVPARAQVVRHCLSGVRNHILCKLHGPCPGPCAMRYPRSSGVVGPLPTSPSVVQLLHGRHNLRSSTASAVSAATVTIELIGSGPSLAPVGDSGTAPSLAAIHRPAAQRPLLANGNSSPAGSSAPSSTADQAQAHSNMVATRIRLSARLSEANAFNDYLAGRFDECCSDVEAASDILNKVGREVSTTARQGEACAAALRFGVDREEGALQVLRLVERLRVMEQVVQEQCRSLAGRVVRRVPVAWSGLANEVRLMGDFDGWTRGCDLSESEEGPDGGVQTFHTAVPLLPGEYLVKFLVDGKWRLASEWPTRVNASGDTNNVIVVV